ncbi:hypothetical protein WR25_01041 isoform B [Diploscapter pachys]|uniref:Uncharacterized protein n=1 Tax=Diploscapter pachys TaxID=2018661 RepID=A0A2A2JT22_9BILA|nr:hypothetical protein WR25_01041 isoform B [Diploscapter pachys]
MDPNDELIELSGEEPKLIMPDNEADAIPLLQNDTLPNDFIMIKPAYHEFSTNYFRIALMSIKALFILLLFTLTFVIRRDFYRVFVLLLLSIMVLDLSFDTFSEVKTHLNQLGSSDFNWDYVLVPLPVNESIVYHHSHAGQIFEIMLGSYTTYTVYNVIWWLPPISYLILSTLFWQLLISSTVVFYYLHRAVVSPNDIVYSNYM